MSSNSPMLGSDVVHGGSRGETPLLNLSKALGAHPSSLNVKTLGIFLIY